MVDNTQALVDLPLDVISLIIPYLDVKSFVSLCRTCRAFQQPEIRFDPLYWRQKTRSTFRVPVHLLVENDGKRWCHLYERLLTQSRVYCWGTNEHNRLGLRSVSRASGQPRLFARTPVPTLRKADLPMEIDTKRIGIVADLQCGGWSTTMLLSSGELYTAGSLSGSHSNNDCNSDGPEKLQFPPGYLSNEHSVDIAAEIDPSVQTRQFSTGRSHILALSETGKIWSWSQVKKPAVSVKFLSIETIELDLSNPNSRRVFWGTPKGKVRQVVAGWDKSTAYIYEYGIVVWDILRQTGPTDDESDTMLVMEPAVVPRTSYQPTVRSSKTDTDTDLASDVGTVLNYIVLEHYVVFITSLGRVFAAKFTRTPRDTVSINDPFELRAFRRTTDSPMDIYGTFRTFGVLKDNMVITSSQGYITRCEQNIENADFDPEGDPEVKQIPAMQNSGVIALAFGDYHFHALHSSGHITSYGAAPDACGALGLGSEKESLLRGQWAERRGFGSSPRIWPESEKIGRRVWFEHWRHQWLRFMVDGGNKLAEARNRMGYILHNAPQERRIAARAAVSEWVEQRGREWDEAGGYVPAGGYTKTTKTSTAESSNYSPGSVPYFALSVSAAGWHSAAIVLANSDLEEKRNKYRHPIGEPTKPVTTSPDNEDSSKTNSGMQMPGSFPAESNAPLSFTKRRFGENIHGRPTGIAGDEYEYVWADEPWPRLRLPNTGEEMPGEAPFSEWPYGQPY